MIANGGEIDGVRLLSEARVREMAKGAEQEARQGGVSADALAHGLSPRIQPRCVGAVGVRSLRIRRQRRILRSVAAPRRCVDGEQRCGFADGRRAHAAHRACRDQSGGSPACVSGTNALSYALLEQRFREIGDLGHAQAMLGWDEAVMMPTGGGARRGDVLATLAGIVHRQLTSQETADLIAAAGEESELDEWQRANLREIDRAHTAGHRAAGNASWWNAAGSARVANRRGGRRAQRTTGAPSRVCWVSLIELTREMAAALGSVESACAVRCADRSLSARHDTSADRSDLRRACARSCRVWWIASSSSGRNRCR